MYIAYNDEASHTKTHQIFESGIETCVGKIETANIKLAQTVTRINVTTQHFQIGNANTALTVIFQMIS